LEVCGDHPGLKPGKPPSLSTSYRPISLLSPVAKILEKLVQPLLVTSLPRASTQHGFAPFRSTTTALLPIVTQAIIGFNQNKPPVHTVVVALDLSKAFDSVDHTLLIDKISASPFNSNLVLWLAAWLRGRTASCLFRSVFSRKMIIRTGTPQGAVLSPDLYNYFVNDFPDVAQVKPSFADNFTIGESAPDLPTLTAALNEDLVHIHQWTIDKKITIAPKKSCIILFTPDQAQFHHHPLVYLNGKLIPLDMALMWLGVNFYPKINFGIQAKASKGKGSSRVLILKALTGTDWGHDMETILRIYKCLILSCMSFNSPIWFPNTSATNIQGLQSVQNSALRIAMGCHLATPIAHLYTECRILPVKNHFEMLNSQFLAKTLGCDHCSREVVTRPSGPRKMKKTLYDANIKFVRPYLTDGVMIFMFLN
jgi:hypothetical protein